MAVTDANAHRTTFAYDPVGRKVLDVDPLGRRTTMTYDAVGRLQSRVDARLARTTFVYDAAGQQTSRHSTDGTRVTLAYDAVGNRTRLHDPTGRYTYSYCCPGRLLVAENPRGMRISYAYDALHRRSRMSEPTGGRFTYQYDLVGRISRLTNPQGDRTTWSYDAAGRPTVVKLANGTRASTTYDAAGQIARLANLKSDFSVLCSFDYAYDAVGNRTHVVEASGDRITWTYDATNQLLSESRSGTLAETYTYTWDPVGNAVGFLYENLPATATYDAANQFRATQFAAAGWYSTFTYDAAGNQVQDNTADDRVVTLIWDDANRLTGTRFYKLDFPEAPSWVNTLTYNGDGQLVERSQGVSTFPTTLERLVWDGQNVLSELREDDSTRIVYTLEPRTYGNLVSGYRPGDTQRRYHHYNALGTTDRITNESQMVVEQFAYRAFGDWLLSDFSNDRFTWNGRHGYFRYRIFWDEYLYYVRARHYDAAAFRWTARDPLGRAGGDENLYRYVFNNAVNTVDPTGLRCHAAPCTQQFTTSVTAKAYIAHIPLPGGVGALPVPRCLYNTNAQTQLTAFAYITNINFSENPMSDSKSSSDYRLYTKANVSWTCDCDNNTLKSYVTPSIDQQGGDEITAIGTVRGSINFMYVNENGQVASNAGTPIIASGKTIGRRWRVRVWGEPHPTIEPAFQSICYRTSTNIWHEIEFSVRCIGSLVTAVFPTKRHSNFPSHRIFVSDLPGPIQTIQQHSLASLWYSSPTLGSTFVSEP